MFVPPAYFETLASALKRPVVPPIGAVSYTSALSSLKLEPETELRPTSHRTGQNYKIKCVYSGTSNQDSLK